MTRRASPRAEPRRFDDPVAEQLAWLMDTSIGIGPFTFGLDALIGLIPGLGDLVSSMVSTILVLRAMKAGVHRAAILRMVLNIGIDTLVGTVPVVGDVFDAAYKSNVRNLRIYQEALSGDRRPLRDWGFVLLVIVMLLLIIALPVFGLLYIIEWITS